MDRRRTVFIIAVLLLVVLSGLVLLARLWMPDPTQATPVGTGPAAATTMDYQRYAYGNAEADRVIDIGTVVPSMQVLYVSESLMHDRILQGQLAANGWSLREHGYRTGADMMPYLDGRLDVALLGDIAAQVAVAAKPVDVYLTSSTGTMTFVAMRGRTAQELKGQRVGFFSGTVTHFGVWRTLSMGGLTLADVIPVQVLPDQMEAAFRDGKIDGGSCYEPYTSRILANLPQSAAIMRYETYTFLCMDRSFVSRHPDIANAILAAVYRASRWVGQSEDNMRTTLGWMRQAQIGMQGYSTMGSGEPWLGQMQRETIGNPSYPMLPQDFAADTSLQHEQFEFLKQVGLIPASLDWSGITAHVRLEALPEVVREGKAWAVERFDYAPDQLYGAGR